MKKISIITVNYNGLRDTLCLIESLLHWVDVPFEIIVVDNGSREDEAAVIRQKYPQVRVIRSERNLGFAGGNNLGIAIAEGDYLLFINNDTLVEDASLKYLAEALERDDRIGGISPKIRFAFEPRHIQFAGYTPLTTITLRNALIGFAQPDDGSFDAPHETPFLHGAAMMFRKSAVENVGKMPECYFLYYEELDWGEMFRRAGYTLWYEPRATVFHKESQSTGQNSPFRTYFLTRNRLLFAYRNRRGLQRMGSLVYQYAIASSAATLRFAVKGQFKSVWAVWRGLFGFLIMKKDSL